MDLNEHTIASEDIAYRGYGPITIRVAWTLLASGIRLNALVLNNARDHVLFHLSPSLKLAHAEDRAGSLTTSFINRARRKSTAVQHDQDNTMLLSPRWRKALSRSLTPLTRSVFHQHYSDGRPLKELETLLQVDRIALEGARGGLREVIRRTASLDGLPLESWSTQRLDQLLRRMAAFSTGPCPPLSDILTGTERAHLLDCARCDRTERLLRSNLLTQEDLIAPVDARPQTEVTTLLLHFHPNAISARRHFIREATFPVMPVGPDLLFLACDDEHQGPALVELACQIGLPNRRHLRGLVLAGQGRWSRQGLLGPLAQEGIDAVHSRGWGHIEGLPTLPIPLPPPPSARKHWLGLSALAAAASLILASAFSTPPKLTDYPLAAVFTQARGGYWSAFDVNEHAHLTIVRHSGDTLEVLLDSNDATTRLKYANGDGSYRLHSQGDGVLIAASQKALSGLKIMIRESKGHSNPLDELRTRIERSNPRADVHFTPTKHSLQ